MFFAEEAVNPVAPDIQNIFWGAVFFIVLLILMYAVCLPAVTKAMRQRDDQRRLDGEGAERALQDAEQVRRDYDATLAAARAEAARIVDEARQAADARRTELIRAAEAEVTAERQRAMSELEAERATALAGLRPSLGAIAVGAASKVVGRTLDVASNQSVVDAHVDSADRG